MTKEEMQGLSCVIGIAGALSLRAFERTFKPELPKEGREYLIRAWIALESMPKDAGLEKGLLWDALSKLRDEWSKS